jgi:Uncharacterized protein conserved in bacteria
MVSPPSPEASEIRRRGRRRLLGAVTLVLLAVVFIPMILDSEPRPQRTTPSLDIPAKENVAPLPAPAPAATPAAATKIVVADKAPASASGEVDVPTPSSGTPQSGNGPGSNSPAAKVTPVAPKVAPDVPRTAAKLEGFAVQVGAFRDDERLRQTRAKLEGAGIVHYTERVEANGGAITRLRAGPFPTREAAEQARNKLKAASLDGQVVPLP